MRKLGCALGGGSEAQRGLHVNTLVDMELQRTEDDSAKYLRGGGGAFASGDPIVMLLVQWPPCGLAKLDFPSSGTHLFFL